MKRFSPYTIHHWQLKDVYDNTLPAGNHYVVIWREKTPLGHCWLKVEKGPVAMSERKAEISAAIGPALAYYEKVPEGPRYLEGEGPEFLVGEGPMDAAIGDQGRIDVDAAVEAIPGLSVVICTRNRPESLERCIRALLDGMDKDFELIVVDNAPDDDQTEMVVRKFPRARYVKEERKG